MKVALYARVSTSDKDQDPETQLMQLRDFATAQGWDVHNEYVDSASALDMTRRTAWRKLLDGASKRRFDVLLIWRVDRAFRSVLDAATTLERLRGWKVGLRSYSEPWIDTTTPFGEAFYFITAAYAGLERGILAERVKAGMERARRQGKQLGRPRVMDRPGLKKRLPGVLENFRRGDLSLRQAAKELRIGATTFRRLAEAEKG